MDLLGYIGVGLGITAALGAVVANVVWSRPRIESLEGVNRDQSKQIRDLQDAQSTMQATLHEKDVQLNLLGDMVKSVPAFSELTKTVTAMQFAIVGALRTNTDAMTDEIQAHERRSQDRDDKAIAVLDAIAKRMERHSDHRMGDQP